MAKYKVTVERTMIEKEVATRDSTASVEIEVEALDKKEAKKLALSRALEMEFDYEPGFEEAMFENYENSWMEEGKPKVVEIEEAVKAKSAAA